MSVTNAIGVYQLPSVMFLLFHGVCMHSRGCNCISTVGLIRYFFAVFCTLRKDVSYIGNKVSTILLQGKLIADSGLTCTKILVNMLKMHKCLIRVRGQNI